LTDVHLQQAAERVALVTGASSGIGRALSLALAQSGFKLCAVGRSRDRLADTVAAAEVLTSAKGFEFDIARVENLKLLVEAIKEDVVRLDVLVHAAGVLQQGTLDDATIDDFDEQYRINVRAPYALTQLLLPLLVRARGQVVFLNSSVGLAINRPEIAQYAATKHALKAVADSVRAELNPKGVKVLSVYLGRTATPMQAMLFQQEARVYDAKRLLQPEDVATMVLAALALPRAAEVTDMSIRPMEKT